MRLCICWSRASLRSSSQDWSQRYGELTTQPTQTSSKERFIYIHRYIYRGGELHFLRVTKGKYLGSCLLLSVPCGDTESKVFISKVQRGYGLGRRCAASPACATYITSSFQAFLGSRALKYDSTVPYSTAFKLGIPASSFLFECTRI